MKLSVSLHLTACLVSLASNSAFAPSKSTSTLRGAAPYIYTCLQSATQSNDSTVPPSEERSISCDALGGEIRRIKLENDDDGFLTKLSVPSYAIQSEEGNSSKLKPTNTSTQLQPTRKGLEGIVPGAFIVQNAISIENCEEIIDACEKAGFGKFNAGRNHHGAMQLLVTDEAAEAVGSTIFSHVDMHVINIIASSMPLPNGKQEQDVEYDIAGLNRRWRIYRYEQGGEENFGPHIDAGFPPSSLSKDGSTLIWNALDNQVETTSSGDFEPTYADDTMSRLTVLMYLNDDFDGGHTKFYTPKAESSESEVIAAVKPKAGSILIFPQAVGEEAVQYAREHWPLHEGSPVSKGARPKYVIRSDVLFTKARTGLTEEEKIDPIWKNDEFVRAAFLPKSPAFSSTFLNHVRSLYNPAMGVENAGPLLYSLVRFTKARTIVEIGAGFTTLWVLQALKDNDDEMKNISDLRDEGKCTLLDIDWIPEGIAEGYNQNKSSLLCIDNCLHQRQTATGAGAVAKTLGLSEYLNFIMGDAYDMQFEQESIDMLWCDFGVGSRMKDFAKGAWKAIKPGGFLVCHSTLTNLRTREWLEAVRRRASEEETGLPEGEFVEISLLEPQKRYQNSVTILQRRRGPGGEFNEPIYSEYA
jgi:predicted O-methyltransferase YrrM